MSRISGDKELIAALNRLGVRASKAMRQGINATAQQVRNTAVKSIQQVSQGETVTRYSQGGQPYSHVASVAGDAPNTDTGALVKSIAVEQESDLAAFVGSGLEYAPYLEFGTRKMRSRPWLQPAADANAKNLTVNITRAVQRLLNERQ